MKIKLLDLFVVGRINIRTTNEPFLIGFWKEVNCSFFLFYTAHILYYY
jgi:hypothetical protein